MSKFERLLMAASTELPECRCGSEMKIIKSDAIGSDAQVRTYQVLFVNMSCGSQCGGCLSDAAVIFDGFAIIASRVSAGAADNFSHPPGEYREDSFQHF
jgi:hypothetical protein